MTDTDKLINAHKIPVIIFIICITIANGLLILTTARKRGFLYKPRSLIIISLALGDIFLALFSLIMNARIIFEFQSLIIPCSMVRTAVIYSMFLIHFVYGVGLITLAMEMLIQYNRQKAAGNTFTTFKIGAVLSAIPWLIGLAVALTINRADSGEFISYWEYPRCTASGVFSYPFPATTFRRLQAMYSVSVPLLACLVVVCIAVMCVRLTPALYTAESVPHQGATPGVVLSTHTTTNIHQQNPMIIAPSAQPFPTFKVATDYNQLDSKLVPSSGMFSSSKSQFIPYPTQYPTECLTQEHTTQSNVIISAPGMCPFQCQNTKMLVISGPTRQKKLLLAVSIVYFICVVPYASLVIGITHFLTFGSDEFIITMIIFYWLAVFRSFITPVIWMVCSRNIV